MGLSGLGLPSVSCSQINFAGYFLLYPCQKSEAEELQEMATLGVKVTQSRTSLLSVSSQLCFLVSPVATLEHLTHLRNGGHRNHVSKTNPETHMAQALPGGSVPTNLLDYQVWQGFIFSLGYALCLLSFPRALSSPGLPQPWPQGHGKCYRWVMQWLALAIKTLILCVC